MNYVSKLTDVLSDDLAGWHKPDWHKARLKFMARPVSSLLQLATVNFTELALTLKPSVKADSNYRRIQRFVFSSLWLALRSTSTLSGGCFCGFCRRKPGLW